MRGHGPRQHDHLDHSKSVEPQRIRNPPHAGAVSNVADHGNPDGMCGKGRDVSVAFPPGRGERGRPVDEVAMAVVPSAAVVRQESSPRNFQGVRRNLVRTGGKVSPPNMAATARTFL